VPGDDEPSVTATDPAGSSPRFLPRAGAAPDEAREGSTAESSRDTASAPIADGVDHPLDPRIIPLERITGAFTVVFIAFASFAAVVSGSVAALTAGRVSWLAVPPFFGAWTLANAAFAWHMYRWPAVAYRYASYRVDDQGIEIRRGVFWRRIINVPRSRVQHTDVSQGPLERRYGLGTLVIHTAGTDHARVVLEGLDHGVALRIREHLLPGETSDAV
jgi:hypothetical protein